MNRKRERGTSLVEVTIALGILLILMIGILQMFSLAYLQNLNSRASMDLTYKAQQVSEMLRFCFFQTANGRAVTNLPAGSLTVGTHTLPDTSTDGGWAFWGPGYLNIIDRQRPPYTVTYTVTDGGTDWTLVVRIQAKRTGVNRYTGISSSGKVVEYASQMPKNP